MGNWVVEMQALLDNPDNYSSQEEIKTSIYKVPNLIPKFDTTAYQPQVVSFGPYHHGRIHLASMEAHKVRAVLRFISRSSRCMQEVFNSVEEVVDELKDSYESHHLKRQYNTEKFVQLMMLDGCFMLELLQAIDSSDNDPIFSKHALTNVFHLIRIDMLMLENQLPMSLLLKLKNIITGPDIEALNKDILTLLGNGSSYYPNMGKCSHVLDLYRKSLLYGPCQSPDQGEGTCPKIGNCLHKLDHYRKRLLHTRNKPKDANQGGGVVCPATELHTAGVRFMKSESQSLQDITFNSNNGVLKLPNFTVDDSTKSIFLNLIAFERCHFPPCNDITSFVTFMDLIINDSQDIKFLISEKIITNIIGTNKKAANVFNTMGRGLTLPFNGNLDKVHTNLINYCNKSWPKHRANLCQNYFKSPWAIISVVAAFVLFSLTAVQTIFTILN